MRWYMRLRWRLVGIQLLVVVIGVIFVLLATQLWLNSAGEATIEPALSPFIESNDTIETVSETLLGEMRQTVIGAVAIAATGAVIVGVLASLLLWRTVVVPLRTLALSSERIADGRYSERVPVPEQAGEALKMVALNFNEMAQSLEKVEEQRVTLIGNVTHELRTPLTGLKGMIEGIEDGIYKPEPQTFQRISAEMDRLTRLIDDIQNLSRIEAAAIHLEFDHFPLAEAVQQVVSHLRPQALAKEIELEVTVQDDGVDVWADRDRTAQILANLINNGIRYTPAGGHLTITIQNDDQAAYAHVQDNGIGIPRDELPFIFERFYRVDQSRSRQSGGLGSRHDRLFSVAAVILRRVWRSLVCIKCDHSFRRGLHSCKFSNLHEYLIRRLARERFPLAPSVLQEVLFPGIDLPSRESRSFLPHLANLLILRSEEGFRCSGCR